MTTPTSLGHSPTDPAHVGAYHAALGAICHVLTRSPLYCQYPIACIHEWIRPAVLHQQYHLFQDGSGNPVGYMTWALLAEDTEQRLLTDPSVLLHLSEWNEGDRLWVLDFVVLNHDVRRYIGVAKGVLASHGQAKSLRRREDGSVRKVVHW